MTYTLVGAPALGFDLARLTGGERVAAVLRAVVRADPPALAALAARHPGPVRDSWQAECEAAAASSGTRRTGAVLPEVAATLGDPGADSARLRELEESLLGDVAALSRLVGDLLDPAEQPPVGDPACRVAAAEVLTDAAVAAYVGETVPAPLRRAMALPFLAARLPLCDVTVPTGVLEADERLACVALADDHVRMAWRRAVDAQRRRTAAWAPAMHQATWALSLTDRLRLALDAQMAAVQVFSRAGFTPRDAAHGVWNALSGVVQASLVGDLLGSRDADVLLAPWRAVHGA